MKKETKIKTKLISFTMKAVIATGQYENIQPEITVEATTLEQAHELVIPYIKSLHNQFSVNAVKQATVKTEPTPAPMPTMTVTEATIPTTLSEPAMVAINATKATSDPVVLAQLKSKILASTKIPQEEINYIISTYFS